MLKAGEAAAKIYDSNDSGNNQDSMHLLVNPFQKAVLPVGFVSDRYQSSVVLRMAAIRSRGSKRLKPLTQRKLTENWMKEEMVPGFFRKIAGKISTLAANLDRGAETSRKQKKNCWVLSGFRLCYCQKRTDILRPLQDLLSVSFFRCHGHTHFHENSSQAPFLLLLCDDLYVPNLNANSEKNSLPQWFIMHSQI